MVPPLPDLPHDDSEFDLDVRLRDVARHVLDERGEKPEPPGSITMCTCPASHCDC
jgi:hypothetical protein